MTKKSPKVTKVIDDEETIQHVADALQTKYPEMARGDVEAIVREEFGAIAGRPVRDYLSILTERAAKKRIKKAIAAA
ncbi:three-helix bundle dimerization domain-containing protein [Mycetocola sp. 2940]|uniref:three-helix bundle dimerization domain-containing protein n=1 Tax=Mycetocola sp. 2940 TaxID=3156452 RepID=UPI0033986A3C